jgi:hypothetical protein
MRARILALVMTCACSGGGHGALDAAPPDATVPDASPSPGAAPLVIETGAGPITTWRFADTSTGATAAVTLFVRNVGTTPQGPIAIDLRGTAAASFAIDTSATACTGATLAPGDRCAVRLTFAPTSAGEAQATLHVADPETLDLPLGGHAYVAQPGLVANVSEIDFGVITVGTMSVKTTVALTNTSTSPITMQGCLLTPRRHQHVQQRRGNARPGRIAGRRPLLLADGRRWHERHAVHEVVGERSADPVPRRRRAAAHRDGERATRRPRRVGAVRHRLHRRIGHVLGGVVGSAHAHRDRRVWRDVLRVAGGAIHERALRATGAGARDLRVRHRAVVLARPQQLVGVIGFDGVGPRRVRTGRLTGHDDPGRWIGSRLRHGAGGQHGAHVRLDMRGADLVADDHADG